MSDFLFYLRNIFYFLFILHSRGYFRIIKLSSTIKEIQINDKTIEKSLFPFSVIERSGDILNSNFLI